MHADPIETVSGLCAYPDLQVNVVDKFKKTPLHYAASLGSTISSIYLINKKANLEAQDIFKNTPLGVAISNKKFGYAISLV